MLAVSHMPYAEDFSHFEQKKQCTIKMKRKQRKYTWDSDFAGPAIFVVGVKTQVDGYFYGKDKNPAIWLTILVLALLHSFTILEKDNHG